MFSQNSSSDIQNICVTCLSNGKWENAFALTYEEKKFIELFDSCMGFELCETSALKYICHECIKTIIAFDTFKENAIKSYNELMQLYTKQGVNLKDDIKTECEDSSSQINIELVKIEDENIIETIKLEGDKILVVESEIQDDFMECLEEDAESSDERQENNEGEEKESLKSNEDFWHCKYCSLVLPKDKQDEIKLHRAAEKKKRIIVHPCPVCGKKYSSTRLKVHIFMHGPQKPSVCEICGKGMSSNQALKIHMMQHEGKKFVCTICKKGFAEQYILKEHMNEHEKVETYLCQICGKSFLNKTKLRYHNHTHIRKASRNNGNSFICEKCGSCFPDKRSLEIHVASHDSKNTINCERCGKQFHHHSLLTAHMWHHIAEFRCLKCFKIYQKDDLSNHQCFPPEDEKFINFLENECRTCGELLKESNLERHMKKHAERECGECGKKFPNARKLMFHRNSHQLKCNLCDKGFVKKENYERHIEKQSCVKKNQIKY